MVAMLGEPCQLGPEGGGRTQVLRRTGRARFNPMRVWLLPVQRLVRGEYEVRGDAGAAKSLLDQRVSGRLVALGLSATGESVEEWGGTVLTRRDEGRCGAAESAAAAAPVPSEE